MASKKVLAKIEQARVERLDDLDLSGHGLTALPESIGLLKYLKHLDLSNNRLTTLPDWLGELKHLQELDVSDNQLTELPNSIGELKQLKRLYASDNQLAELPDSIGELKKLEYLDLDKNQLTELPDWLGELKQLEYLYVEDNKLTELPDSIGELKQLIYLDLENNQLTELPESIQLLRSLKHLNLSHNKFTTLPDWLGELKQLRELHVFGNQLTGLPPEIRDASSDDILAYLQQLAKDKTKRYEGKLIIVGQGGVGKTCLSRALRGKDFKNQDTTHGIEIQTLEIPHHDIGNQDITLNIWDFGGQVIGHSTHQFFLTERSLYVLVFNARLEAEAGRIDYWLETIRTRTPNAKVLIVATECHERTAKLDFKRYRDRYEGMIVGDDFYKVDSRSGEGVKELRQRICEEACKIKWMGQEWPKAYADVEEEVERLRDKKKTYITRNELYRIMKSVGIENQSEQARLAVILGELGKITHFPNSTELGDMIVLNPQWLTGAISKALELKALDDANGTLEHKWLKELWQEDYPGLHGTFYSFMREFEICYPLTGNLQSSLVPLRFAAKEKDPKWSHDQKHTTRRVIYKFHFVPPGIMARFIVKTHRMATGIYWENGVFLEIEADKSEAFCRLDPLKREFTIEVRSAYPQYYLEKLWGYLESILNEYKGLKPEKFLGCIGTDENHECDGEFEWDEIQDALDVPINDIRCHKGKHYLKTLDFVYGLAYFSDTTSDIQVIKEVTQKTYAELISFKDHFGQMFAQQQRVLLDWMMKLDKEIFKLCPTLVSIVPMDRSGYNPSNWFNQQFQLHLYCQAEEGIHPEGPVHTFSQSRQWWQKTAPYLKYALTVAKFISGPAGAIIPTQLSVDQWNGVKDEFGAMEKFLEKVDLKSLETDKVDRSAEMGLEEIQGSALRAISTLLDELDPHKEWDDYLTRVLTPDGKFLWLCEEHKKKYLPPKIDFDG